MTHVLALIGNFLHTLRQHKDLLTCILAAIIGSFLTGYLLHLHTLWKARTSLVGFFYNAIIASNTLYSTLLWALLVPVVLIPVSHSRVCLALSITLGFVFLLGLHATIVAAFHDHIASKVLDAASAAEKKVLADAQPMIEQSVQKAVFN